MKSELETSKIETIRDLVTQLSRNDFTDRENEISAFKDIIDPTRRSFRILAFNGIAGVGKSYLLTHLSQVCNQRGIPCILIDCSKQKSPLDFIFEFRKQLLKYVGSNSELQQFDILVRRVSRILQGIQDFETKKSKGSKFILRALISSIKTFIPFLAPILDGVKAEDKAETALENYLAKELTKSDKELLLEAEDKLTSQLLIGINSLTSQQECLVIILDTLETIGDQENWVRDNLISGLTTKAAVVLAGRNQLSNAWKNWRGVIREITLVNFTDKATKYYLQKRGVDEEKFAEEIFQFTYGHPMSVALSVDIKEHTLDAPKTQLGSSEKFLVIDSLVERIIAQITDRQTRSLLEASAVVRQFNQDLLHYLEPEICNDQLFREFIKYSFVKFHDDHFSLHDLVREFISANLKAISPDRFKALNEKAVKYYQNIKDQKRGKEYQKTELEILYHTTNTDTKASLALFQSLFENAARVFDVSFCEAVLNEMRSHVTEQDSIADWIKYYQSVLHFRKGQWSQQNQICLSLLREPRIPNLLYQRVSMDLANSYMRQGKIDMAEKLLQRSLQKIMNSDETILYSDMVFELGKIYRWKNLWEKSLFAFKDAQGLFEQQKRESRVAEAIMHMGAVEQHRGHLHESKSLLAKSTKLFESTTNLYGQSRSMLNLGWVCMRLGEWDEAERHCNRSLEIAKSLDVEHSMASIFIILGNIKRLRKEFDDAEFAFQQSRLILEKLTYDIYLGFLNQVEGLLNFDLGNFDEALNKFNKSEDVYQSLGAIGEMCNTLCAKGQLYLSIGEKSKALSVFEKVLNNVTAYENRYAEVAALIGTIFSNENWTNSNDVLNKAFQLCNTFMFRDHLATLMKISASKYLLEKDFFKAGESYAKAFQEAYDFNPLTIEMLKKGFDKDILSIESKQSYAQFRTKFKSTLASHSVSKQLGTE